VRSSAGGRQSGRDRVVRRGQAISGERDQARVVTMLKKAAGALGLVGGGDVAPAAERTHETLKAILGRDSNPRPRDYESGNWNLWPLISVSCRATSVAFGTTQRY